MKNTLTLRLDQETKDRITSAARRKGQTMTTFIAESAGKAADIVNRQATPASNATFRGSPPTYFRALCAEATRGGKAGYHGAGYELTRHLPVPDDLTSSEWAGQMKVLAGRTRKGNDSAVLEWFDRYYPSCMALVPARRRDQFAAGVFRCVEDEKAGLAMTAPGQADSPLIRSLQEARDAVVALPSGRAASKEEVSKRIGVILEAGNRLLIAMDSIHNETDPQIATKARALIAETKKLLSNRKKLLKGL